MQQTKCTSQYPHCAKGTELQRVCFATSIALQNATAENWVKLDQASSDAVAAYLQHVKVCEGGDHAAN